ncbi:hypothetical protein SNE40_005614 [Patella caerulea]|uniref:Uncharacterized protein n=1 Tax=Patella caerulea TaxID=87958 RepID=A0AAN8Q072_PATCE
MNERVFQCGARFIHIYRQTDDTRIPKCVISSSEEIKQWCTGSADLNWFLLCCCKNGVYRVDDIAIKRVLSDNSTNSSEVSNKDDVFNQLLQDSSTELIQLTTLPHNVYKLTEKDKVWHDETSSTTFIKTYLDFVIIITKSINRFYVNFYKIENFKPEEKRRNISPEIQFEYPVKTHTIFLSTQQADCMVDLEKIKNKTSVYIITSQNFNDRSCESAISLPHELFIALFNKQCEPLTSPVMIFCRDDGCIFFSILKTDVLRNTATNLFCEIDSSIVAINYMNVTYCENNTIESKTDILYNADSDKELPALVLLSSSGKVLLFMVIKSKKCWYSSHISGHVLSACVCDRTYLYHSNGQFIYKTKFYFIESNNRIENESTLLHDVRVKEMYINKINTLQDEQVFLECQTVKNTIISLPVVNSTLPRVSSNLKDILHGIEENHQKLTDISLHQKHLNNTIQQINLAANIVYNTSGKLVQADSRHSTILSCEIKIQPILKGTSQRYSLNVNVTNQSKIKFSSDWSLLINLSFSNKLKVESHSVNLIHGLETNKSIQVKVPVTSQIKDVQLLMVLKPMLKSDSHLLNPIELCIPLYQCELNILDFLLSDEHYNGGTLEDYNGIFCENDETRVPESKIYTSHLLVSGSQLKSVIFFNKTNHEIAPDSILRFILNSNQDVVWDIKDGSCKLRDDNGHMISLSVNLKPQPDTTNTSTIDKDYVVNLHSDNCSLLAGVRAAVLQNLKICSSRNLSLIKPSDRHHHTKQFEEVKLNIEELQLKLNENSKEENIKEMYIIYEKLRKAQL